MSGAAADAALKYFCIDVEASGPVPGLYSMLSLGCAAVTEGPEGELRPGRELYVELRPCFEGVEDEAIAVTGLDIARLEREGLAPRDAMAALRRFVLEETPAGHRPIFVGHNAPFDWSYIAYYFAWAKMRNPFGYKALDTKALAMGKLDIPWLATNKDVLADRLEGVEREDRTLKHRADYDARYQAGILAALLDYRRPSGSG